MAKPQTPPEPDKNKEVKEQILRAAKTLFTTRGYDGTSVRQICEEADVSLALVSYHFGGKEKLFYELFNPIREIFRNQQFDLADPEKALKQFCMEFVRNRYSENELINILQQELLMNSPRLDMLTDVFLPSWDHLRQILQACKQCDIIECPSVDTAVRFVMGTLMYSIQLPFLNQSGPAQTPEETARFAADYVLKGLSRR
ncbi:TetR/AcrR family transcriptional regulator [Paenibacillus protaetiae]|uniref:TetR/AcrR family transcriptional regulator n=1 Tax=Paenibacillus protaetiae TaxID=2509456 RepID=A0A4P6ETI9_9BACL|nr:TetR/AcrR family transcriptional regulator [Paenibacillus protaetiae]QAY65755.1 TetR/AcrR family transcriptional regulator [Paenibacillus protaetiae]